MSRYADPDRCPDCRAALPAPPAPRPACPACGLSLTGTAAVELFTTLQRADQLVGVLRAAGAATPSQQPEPVADAGAATSPGVLPAPVPAPTGHPHRGWTVPAVLLSLGGLCLVVGALVFLAVTWSVLGVGGRTAVLVGLTAIAAGGTWWGARRGLRAAAETLATVTGLFLALDLAGAANAGWLGDASPATLVLAAALVVAVAPAAGNLALRQMPTGLLVAPQVVATAAVVVAAFAALMVFDTHPTVTASVVIGLAAGGAAVTRRTGQVVLAIGAAVAGVLMWVVLVVSGLARALESWSETGAGSATWQDVEPLLAAAGFAVAVLVLGRLLHGALVVGRVALVVACWVLTTAIVLVVGDSVTAVVLVAVVAAFVVAPLALAVRQLAVAVGVAAFGLATVAALGAATAVVVLVAGIGQEVADQLAADRPDLLAHADLPTFGSHLAAPWTVPLAVSALVAAVVVLAPPVRPVLRRRRADLTVGLPVLAVPVLCYAPVLLVVLALAVALAALHLLPRTRPWRPEVDVSLAIGWTAVAALVSLYDPWTATLLAVLVTAVVTWQVVHAGSRLGQLAVPPLVAASIASAAWLVGAPWTWGVAAIIVGVSIVAVVLGSASIAGSAALVTCVVAIPFGLDAVSGAVDAWSTAYLSLTAAGAAAMAIRDRSRAAAVASAVAGLAATWVRLVGSGVETPEAYTVPLAAVLLGFGGWSWWRDRDLGTMRSLAPGLAVALVPSLVVTLRDPVSLRALLLAATCAALIAVGAMLRLRAPLVTGAAVGAVLVVAELAPFHDAVPRWVLLTAAGICLVTAGVRWEQLAALGRRGWGRLHELA